MIVRNRGGAEGPPEEAAHVDRFPEAHLTAHEGSRYGRTRRLDAVGAAMPAGMMGTPVERQAGHAGAAPVELPVAGPGALREDPEQLAPIEHVRGRVEGAGGVTAGALDGDHAHGGEHVVGLPVVEVLGLAHEVMRRCSTPMRKTESKNEMWLAAMIAPPEGGRWSRPSMSTGQTTFVAGRIRPRANG